VYTLNFLPNINMHKIKYRETMFTSRLKESIKIDLFKYVQSLNNCMRNKNGNISLCKRIKIILNYKILIIAYRYISPVKTHQI